MKCVHKSCNTGWAEFNDSCLDWFKAFHCEHSNGVAYRGRIRNGPAGGRVCVCVVAGTWPFSYLMTEEEEFTQVQAQPVCDKAVVLSLAHVILGLHP